MPEMDPKIAAFLKAHPDRTPQDAYQVIYGHRGDVQLPPQGRTLGDLVRLIFNPLRPPTDALKR